MADYFCLKNRRPIPIPIVEKKWYLLKYYSIGTSLLEPWSILAKFHSLNLQKHSIFDCILDVFERFFHGSPPPTQVFCSLKQEISLQAVHAVHRIASSLTPSFIVKTANRLYIIPIFLLKLQKSINGKIFLKLHCIQICKIRSAESAIS